MAIHIYMSAQEEDNYAIPYFYSIEKQVQMSTRTYPPELKVSGLILCPIRSSGQDGSGRISKFSDWARHRVEIVKEIQYYEIGTKLAVDPSTVAAIDPTSIKMIDDDGISGQVVVSHFLM